MDAQAANESLFDDLLISEYSSAVDEALERTNAAIQDAQFEEIERNGPKVRLERARNSGIKVSEEQVEMATNSEDVSRAMVGIVQAMGSAERDEKDAKSTVVESLQDTTPHVQHITRQAGQVLRQQLDEQNRLLYSDETAQGAPRLICFRVLMGGRI